MANLDVATGDPKGAEQAFKTALDKAPLRSQSRIFYAQFQFQRGETNQAAESLREILRKAPDYMPANLLLMKFAFTERKYDDCNSYLAQILKRDPDNLDALMQKGAVSMAKGDGKQAVADFQRISALTAKKPIPQVQYELARAYVLSGDGNKAITTLNLLLEAQTNFIPAKLSLADLEIRQGNPASAIALLTELLKLPRLPEATLAQASMALAGAYLAQNVPAQAALLYRRLEDTFPKDAQIPFLTGNALLRNSQPEAARAAFERSLARDSKFLPSLEELVDLDLAQANYMAAGERVKKEINENPTNAVPWLLQAKVCIVTKDVPQAEAALQKAISLDPNLPAPYLILAKLLTDNHQQKEALDKLNALVSITNNVVALMEIAQIHEMDKEYDLARQSYEKLLGVNPQSVGALNNLAYLYSEHFNDLDKAYQTAQKVRELSPFDPHVADTLGWILFKRGEYPRALTLEEESAAKQPNDPEVQFHLGMAHYMMEEEDLARLALQYAASKADFDKKDQALQRLAIIAIDPKTATPAERALVEKEIQMDPADPVAMLRLAALQERDGDLQKAAATYAAAIKQNPKNVRAMARLAQLYSSRLNQPEKGLELAENAHQQAPDDPSISATLGRMIFQSRDYPYALSLLQAAARLMPGQPDLLHDLAWAYFSTGNAAQARTSMESAVQTGLPFARLDDAKQFLSMMEICGNPAQPQAAAKVQQALQADANYAPALMASGLLQEQQGHSKEAEQFYEKVLASYPLFAQANRQLAILYARDGNNDAKAYACAEKARPAFPGDPELARISGMIAYRRKDYRISSQYLTLSTGKSRDDAEALYYLGMDYYQLKDPANSKKTLLRAVALKKLPDDLATQAARVLALLK